MNFATVVRTAAAVAFVAAAVWGQSSAAYAEEIVVESRDETAITHGVSVLAWARVDGASPSMEIVQKQKTEWSDSWTR